MRWLWKVLGFDDLVREMLIESVLYELRPDRFYLIVLPEGILSPPQIDRVREFLNSRGIECLVAAADRLKVIELGE